MRFCWQKANLFNDSRLTFFNDRNLKTGVNLLNIYPTIFPVSVFSLAVGYLLLTRPFLRWHFSTTEIVEQGNLQRICPIQKQICLIQKQICLIKKQICPIQKQICPIQKQYFWISSQNLLSTTIGFWSWLEFNNPLLLLLALWVWIVVFCSLLLLVLWVRKRVFSADWTSTPQSLLFFLQYMYVFSPLERINLWDV